MVYASFGNAELLDWAKELYLQTEIKRIQQFYWISFEELFDEKAMKKKGITDKDLDYVLNNRDREAAIKSKEAWEMRKDLFASKRWQELKSFYWITENDIRDVSELKRKWVKDEDIEFIIWKEEKEEAPAGTEETNLDKLKEEATELWISFSPRIWEATLQEKINNFKANEQS